MKLRTFTILAILLLVLCLGGWLRSYLPQYSTLRTYNGALVVIFYSRDVAPYMDPLNHPTLGKRTSDEHFRAPVRPWDTEQALDAARRWGPSNVKTTRWRAAGFELIATDTRLSWGYFVLAVPFWAMSLPPAAAAAWSLLVLRKRR